MQISSPIHVRRAEARDIDGIVGMMKELVVELGPHDDMPSLLAKLDPDIRLAFANCESQIFVAETENRLIGLSRGDVLTQDPIFRLRGDHRCGYVDQMYVQPPFRQTGLGQRLIEATEEWFRGQKIGFVMLHAAPRAARLYARLGYQPNRQMFKAL